MAGLGTIRVGKNRRVYCVPIWPVKPAPASNPVRPPRGHRTRTGKPRRCTRRGVVVVCLSPWFPRPLRARIRMRDAAPSLCRTERMDAWPRCLERLEAEFPAEDVHAWLKPLQATWRDDATVLYAPNAFVRDEVRSRYLERIRELLGHLAGTPEVTPAVAEMPAPAAERPPPASPPPVVGRTVTRTGNPDTPNPFTNT